jgi:hypothetical protein
MLSVLLLFVVLVSEHVQATDTLLVSGELVLLATPTFSVTIELPFVAAMAFVVVHVTVCPFAMQLQPVPVKLPYVSPAGRVSVTVTVPLVAADPEFDTVIGI